MIRGSLFRPGMTANCTKPPRQREGVDKTKPHNAYPGGKKRRKALAKLNARRRSREALIVDPRAPAGLRERLGNVPGSMK